MERIVRSTHDTDEWMGVISRMKGYGAVSQPIKPQPMLDRSRAGTPEQFREAAEYLASINLSAADHWAYPLKVAAAADGRLDARHRDRVPAAACDHRTPRHRPR